QIGVRHQFAEKGCLTPIFRKWVSDTNFFGSEAAAGLEAAAAEAASASEAAAAEAAAAGEVPATAAARHVPRPAREAAGAERRVRADAPEALLAANRFPHFVGPDRAADEAVEQHRDQRRVHEPRVQVVVAAALETLADVLEREHPLALQLMQAPIADPLVLDALDLVLERFELVD